MAIQIQTLKLEILKLFADAPRFGLQKFNVLGRPSAKGSLHPGGK